MAKNKVPGAVLSKDEMQSMLLESLEDHRHLIQKAVNAMAGGDLVQALTIATSVRVLVHETGASKPLLKCLRSDYLDLTIMDDPSPREDDITLPLPVTISKNKPRIRLNAGFPKTEGTVLVPLRNWWTGPFMNLRGVGWYSRRQLVLDMANKEAAHVDPEISEQYHRLLSDDSLKFTINEEAADINISRLLVGRAGVEVLDCLERNFPVCEENR